MSSNHQNNMSHLRVIEAGDEYGSYCGKLFADLGADVIKIESRSGNPARAVKPQWQAQAESLRFLYENTNKRSVCLNLEKKDDVEKFKKLVMSADIFLDCFQTGYLSSINLAYPQLTQLNPTLIVTSITGFGLTGPQRHFKHSDLIINALSGAMQLTGYPEDPPVQLTGVQSHKMASITAACASMIAYYHATKTGQGQLVDISMLEVMTSVTHLCGIGKWREDGLISKRFGSGNFSSTPSGIYPCKDGYIYLMINRPHHWKMLAKWVHEITGNDEILLPMFEGPSSNRQEYRELIDIFLSDFSNHFTTEELHHEGQKRHIAVSPVKTTKQIINDKSLKARDFFVRLKHAGASSIYPGSPYRFEKTNWLLAKGAPTLGQQQDAIFDKNLDEIVKQKSLQYPHYIGLRDEGFC